jgi:multiple sugar transport system substrate-binding protein
MKKVILGVLCFCMAVSLAFAGGASESTSGTDQASTKKTVVRFWTIDRHDAAFWQPKFDEFNATNTDNIEAKYEIYSDNYIAAVDMAFQTGEAPDMMKQDVGFYNKYLAQGKFEDLFPYMDDDTKAMIQTVLFKGYNYIDGKCYYVPTGNSCFRLFYNKAIFDRLGLKVPTTLDEMVQCAKTITEKLSGEGIYGFACNLKSPTSGLKRSFEPMSELSLDLALGFDFSTGKYEFERLKPIVSAWKEMMKYAFPGCESLDIDPLRTQFAAGKIGMYISYTHAEPGVYASQFPMADGQDWGCAYIPILNGEYQGKSNFTATPAFLMNSASKNKDAAWKAYKAVILNPVNLRQHYEQGYGIGLIPAAVNGAVPGKKYQEYPALLRSDHDSLWPLTPTEKYPQGIIIEGLSYYDTIASLIAGQGDIDKGLADLSNRYNTAYQKAIKDGLATDLTIAGFTSRDL